MGEAFQNHYFLAVRTGLPLLLEIYIVMSQTELAGASEQMLLFLAFFVGGMAGKEFVGHRWQLLFYPGLWGLLFGIVHLYGAAFWLLGSLLCLEFLTYLKAGKMWYLTPFVFAFISSGIPLATQLLFIFFMSFIYLQHNFVVEAYQKQKKEDTVLEQSLKHNIYEKELEKQEAVKNGLLQAENQILEERARLSQTLHDKLGHSINGSVYQLEAVKLLMEKEPETSRKMVQAVIEQLRSGMDEIRVILRKQHPKKYELALLQLGKLCEDCRKKGVDAELVTDGDMARVPEKYVEIILDNAYEAVSNSMKYAKCSRIEIEIHVLNQMVRCSISDNGVGCMEVVDGMGISGMRQRVRTVNGILNFETELGFRINMLLPL